MLSLLYLISNHLETYLNSLYSSFSQKSIGLKNKLLGISVVKNPPASVRDMSLIPGPGRSHMSLSNYACAP